VPQIEPDNFVALPSFIGTSVPQDPFSTRMFYMTVTIFYAIHLTTVRISLSFNASSLHLQQCDFETYQHIVVNEYSLGL
jgi:hypothetical protein